MTKILYVYYLTDCLHTIMARPGRKSVYCWECKETHYAVEVRLL